MFFHLPRMMNGQFQTAGQHSQTAGQWTWDNSSVRLQQPGAAANPYSQRRTNVYQQNGQNTALYSRFSYRTPAITKKTVSEYSRTQTFCNMSINPHQSVRTQQHVTYSWNQPSAQQQMSGQHERTSSNLNQQNQWISNQNVNGMQAKSWPSYMSTATSHPQGQRVFTGSVASATANSHQDGNNRIYSHATDPRISHSVVSSDIKAQSQRHRAAGSNFTSNSYGCPLVPTDREMPTNSQPPTSIVDTSKFQPRYNAKEVLVKQILEYLYKPDPVNKETGQPVPVDSQPQSMNRAVTSSVTTTLEGCGNATQTNIFAQGNLVQSTEDASQPMNLNSSISTQGTQALASAVNKQNEISLNSFSTGSASRAVAVVQPLSQESYQVGHYNSSSETQKPQDECTSTDGSLLNSLLKNDDNLGIRNAQLQDTNQKSLVIQQEIAPNDNTVVSTLKSPGPQDSQIHLANVADSQTSQMSHVSERTELNSDTPKSDLATGRKASAPDLSSAQKHPWTLDNLKDLIQKYEKQQADVQEQNNDSCASTVQKITRLYDVNTVLGELKSACYTKLFLLPYIFCKKELTAGQVILTELEQSQMNQIQNVQVLKDGDVYREPPYTSSWLNINENLDDIDKEFGYPYSLRCQFVLKESDTKLDVMDGTNSSEDFDKEFEQTQPRHIDLVEGKQDSDVTTTSTPSPRADDTDAVEPSDPYYSFEIKVLPPSEAKAIAELVYSKAPITNESLGETVEKASVEEEKSDTSVQDEICNDDIVKVTKPKQKTVSKAQGLCCLIAWLEKVCGSKMIEKCNCKKELSQTVKNETTVDREEKTDDINSKPSLHDSEPSSSVTDNELNALNNVSSNNEIQHCTSPANEICDQKTQDDENPFPHSSEEPKTCSNGNEEENRPSIADVTKTADDISDCPSDFKQIPSPCINEECVQEQQESVKKDDSEISATSSEELQSIPSCDLERLEKEGEANRPKDILEPSDMGSITSDLKVTISFQGQSPVIKRKATNSDEMSPFSKKSTIRRDTKSVIPQLECKDDSTKKASGLEIMLMLYGSQKEKSFCNNRFLPPESLTVNLSPPKTTTSSVSPAKYSAKEKVQDRWRKDFIPTNVKKAPNHKAPMKPEEKKQKKMSFVPPDKYLTVRGKKATRWSKPILLQWIAENGGHETQKRLRLPNKKRGGY